MSKPLARLFVRFALILLCATLLGSNALAQYMPSNSIQVSRVEYDGDGGNTYVSPYTFPEIFNDQAGCSTTNSICNTAGIQGSIYIDQFGTSGQPGSVPASPLVQTLSLPSTGTPVTTFPTPEPGISYITTSFSSKSEGALMLSPNGQYLTYMGYQANDQLDDVSNGYSLEPSAELSPNTYTMDASLGTPITITSASESGTTATFTLSSASSAPTGAGAFFTIAGMNGSGINGSYTGYDGTWVTDPTSTASTIVLDGLPSGLVSCSSQSDCAGTATYDQPYGFYDREVALINSSGLVSLTPIDNADSGDNPRAAITVDGNELYTAGNSDSTCTTYPCNPADAPNTPNNPGLTIGVRCAIPEQSQSYQLGTYSAADRSDESKKKHVKDNNWRGIGIYTDGSGNQQLYVSKGSGSNGDDGFFQVGSPLPSCTQSGTDTGNTITELWGAQATVPNGASYQTSPYLPFGFWMPNPTTLYIADEGNPPSFTSGPPSYTPSPVSFQNSTNGTFTLPQLANGSYASDPYAGLEKWSLVSGTWTYDYTIQAGLNLYQSVTVNNYNDANGDAIQTYTYGIRNMTGYNNGDGTVTIYAITSQFSAVSGGEPDPTSVVGITDTIAATTLPATEQFVTLQTSAPGEVYRGVAYVPPAQGFTRQTQTITFPTIPTQTWPVSPITLTASATSGWPIAYTVSGPATVSGNVLTVTAPGSVTVTANQSGNTDYSAAAQVKQTFKVNQEAQSIMFSINAPASAGYGSSFTVAATATSGLQVAYTSAGSCTNYGPTYTINAPSGTCSVIASQGGNGDYAAAPLQTEDTNATKGTPMATFTGAPATAIYDSTFSVSATTNTGITPTITATGSCAINGTTVTLTTGTGMCTTTAKWAADTDYNAITLTQKTSAEKAVPSISWAAPAPITYGTALSGTQLDATPSVAGTLVYSPASGKILAAGSQTLSVKFTPTATSDYIDEAAAVTLDVSQLGTTSTITGISPSSPTAGKAVKVSFTVSASYSNPTGTVTINSNNGEECVGNLLNGNGSCSITFTSPGTYTLTASYGGSNNYSSSSSGGFQVTVGN